MVTVSITFEVTATFDWTMGNDKNAQATYLGLLYGVCFAVWNP